MNFSYNSKTTNKKRKEVFDLISVGAGVYVLTGAVAKEITGPSVVLAFVISAMISIFTGHIYIYINKFSYKYIFFNFIEKYTNTVVDLTST